MAGALGNDTTPLAARTRQRGSCFCSWRLVTAGNRVIDRLREVNNPIFTQGELSHHVVFRVRHPRGSHIVPPLLSLEVATRENKINSLKLSSMRNSASRAVLCRKQPTVHATRRTTSRRFALGASDICLVGESPPQVCMQGSMAIRLRSSMISSTPSPPCTRSRQKILVEILTNVKTSQDAGNPQFGTPHGVLRCPVSEKYRSTPTLYKRGWPRLSD